jgi:copper oxidase (laccase) domain-containing protein
MDRYLTPLQAIKKKCKEDCCAGDLKSWKQCTVTNCYLYSYRLGKRPNNSTQKQSNEEKQIDSL